MGRGVMRLSRRQLLRGAVACAPAVLSPRIALAQRTVRVAMLHTGADTPEFRASPVWQGFLRSLREAGYDEKRNLALDLYAVDGRNERFAEFATAAIGKKADVIIAHSTPAARAAMAATATTPIIAVNISDPVAAGLVTSLARPGGNVTGVANQSADLIGKFFQVLGQVVPGLKRVGYLLNPSNPGHVNHVRDLESAGSRIGVTVSSAEVRRAEDFGEAFARFARRDVRGLIVFGDALIRQNATRIIDLAKQHRIVAIYQFAIFADLGGLMSYGPRLSHIFHRAGALTGRVLNGARPGDLPFEQPSEFDFVVNLRTATAAGISMPPTLMLSATRVIE